jgi:hypothetical protein
LKKVKKKIQVMTRFFKTNCKSEEYPLFNFHFLPRIKMLKEWMVS